MNIDNWIDQGLNSLSSGEIFDGIQLIEGAIQRVFRIGEPDTALIIYRKTNEILMQKDLNEIYCRFILDTTPLFKKKIKDIGWFKLIPEILGILREQNMLLCISQLLNKLVLESKTIEVDLLQSLLNNITEEQYSREIIADLHYYQAGILVYKREYAKCFNVLKDWKSLIPPSPQVLAYLTLAELNAYEIEGCGGYLNEAKNFLDTSQYIELSSHIFKSVEAGNYDLFLSIIEEYNDLVNSKHDALLKGLCDGISDFLKPKGNKGLFSLFGR